MWVVPPASSPKADKSELLVSAEDIGLPYKAQDPVCAFCVKFNAEVYSECID